MSQNTTNSCSTLFTLTLALIATGLTLLALVELLHYRTVSRALAYALAAGAALTVALLFGRATPALETATLPRRLRLVAIPMSAAVLAAAAIAHRADGWDESQYILGGLAIRGYQVPTFPYRPPVTSWLCAAFADLPWLQQPLLLAILLFIVYRWLRASTTELVAALAPFLLLSQNLLLEASLDITSELPAAVFLTAGFYALSRRRVFLAGLLLGLSAFTRWQLLSILAVTVLLAYRRFGPRLLAYFLVTGTGLILVWCISTTALSRSNPFVEVYQYFLSAAAWAASPEQIVNFFTRAEFYLKHFFFLTPVILFGLIINLHFFSRRHLDDKQYVEVVLLPAGYVVYLITLLFIGGLLPRFVTPLFPGALVGLLCGGSRLLAECPFTPTVKVRIAATSFVLIFSFSVWPLYSAVLLKTSLAYRPVFSPSMRQALLQLPRDADVKALALRPLSTHLGQPAMVEARRTIVFPISKRGKDILIEDDDSQECVLRLLKSSQSGDFLLIPQKYQFLFKTEFVLFADHAWALVRRP